MCILRRSFIHSKLYLSTKRSRCRPFRISSVNFVILPHCIFGGGMNDRKNNKYKPLSFRLMLENDGKTQDAVLDYEQANRFATRTDWQPLLRIALAKRKLGDMKYTSFYGLPVNTFDTGEICIRI